MRGFLARFTSAIAAYLVLASLGHSSEKTSSQLLEEAEICIRVEKGSSGPRLKVRESGRNFSADLSTMKACGDKKSDRNLHLERLAQGIWALQIQSEGSILEAHFNEQLDIVLPKTLIRPDLKNLRRCGFQTPANFVNENSSAFYSAVVVAHRIWNKGSLRTFTCQLFQDQLVNDGLFETGKMPTCTIPIEEHPAVSPEKLVEPEFIQGTVLNRGFWLSTGEFNIKGGLSYHERSFGSFDNLKMHGNGAIRCAGYMNVAGILSGSVSSIEVSRGSLYADRVSLGEIKNIKVVRDTSLRSGKDLALKVSTYENSGEISSGGDLTLEITDQLVKSHNGLLTAKGMIRTMHKLPGIKSYIPGERLKGDEALLRYGELHPSRTSENDPEYRKLWEKLLEANGLPYHETFPEISPGRRVGREANLTRIIHHYRNDIYRHFHNGVLVSRTETGLLYRYTEKREEKVTVDTSEYSDFLSGWGLQELKRIERLGEVSKIIARETTRLAPQIRNSQALYIRFLSELMLAGATSNEIFTVSLDREFLDLLGLLANWGLVDAPLLEGILQEAEDLADMYELFRYLQASASHDPSSDWHRRFCQRLVPRLSSTIVNPFSAIAEVSPLLLVYPVAILHDHISDAAFDVVDRYVPKVISTAGLQSYLEYMLEFMSSGIDPPGKAKKSSAGTGSKPATGGFPPDPEDDDSEPDMDDGSDDQEKAEEAQTKTATSQTPVTKPKLLPAPKQLKLLSAPKMVDHHLFNRFWRQSPASKKYIEFFQKHNIKINNYCVRIPASMHSKFIHGTRDWTKLWKEWIDANPKAKTTEVYQFIGRMMDDFGLSHLKIVKYRSKKK